MITNLPTKTDNHYTIHEIDDDYIDHYHLPQDWLYKVYPSEEVKSGLDKTLRTCLGEKDYKIFKREDKLKRILGNES